MTRWLWPILAAFLIGVAFSAMRFDRIDHKNMDKKEWPVLGLHISLSNTLDFYVYAVPTVAAGLLACSLFMWLYAGSKRSAARRALRFPPFGPIPGKSRLERRIDGVVRVTVGTVALVFGSYAAIHLFRHLLMHSVFYHATGQVFHGPGLLSHLSHWSLSRDLRYGVVDGVTYYAGIQTAANLSLLAAGLFFGAWALKRIVR
jgi:hypothetical protein